MGLTSLRATTCARLITQTSWHLPRQVLPLCTVRWHIVFPFGLWSWGTEPNPIIRRLFNSRHRGVMPIENRWETLRTIEIHCKPLRTIGVRFFLEQRECSFVEPAVLEWLVNTQILSMGVYEHP